MYSGQGFSLIGEKGRFVLPPDFRKAVRDSGQGERVLCLAKHPRWKCLTGFGLSRVEVLVDGRSIGDATYGRVFDIRHAWPDSTDPQHPAVGFDATLDTTTLAPGKHWLGLRLHGRDGSVEEWAEQPVHVR